MRGHLDLRFLLVQFQFRHRSLLAARLPAIIAIALDQTIVGSSQRLDERATASLRQVMRVGGRPSIVSSLSILIGMGCLAQVPLPAFREMATVALASPISSATVCTLTLVPALLQISQRGAFWPGSPPGRKTGTTSERVSDK